jgi:quinolinate synthase
MLRYATESTAGEFIVGTETGLLYQLRQANPEKRFYPAAEKMFCADMKKIGLADIVASLEWMTGEVKVPEEIRTPALSAVQRMIDLSG